MAGLATRDQLRDARDTPTGGAFGGMDVLKVKVGGAAPIKDEAARCASSPISASVGLTDVALQHMLTEVY